MVTNKIKKAFALAQLIPYFKDPKTCGYNKRFHRCEYISENGKKMCVAGKNMLDPTNASNCISDILANNTQAEIFKPEAVGILNIFEWQLLQNIHDDFATKNNFRVELKINMLGLFTYDELKEEVTKNLT